MNENSRWIYITESQLHSHLKSRMLQRGITLYEVEYTLNEGWQALDAKLNTLGKTMVYQYQEEWEGKFYEEKEVTIYYKIMDEDIILLTAKARYGNKFSKGE